MGTEVIWEMGGVLPVLLKGYVEKPSPSAKLKCPNCQQNRGVDIFFSSCFVSGRQCTQVWGFLWMEMPIFKCIFATSQICLGEYKGPMRVPKDSLLPSGSRGNVDSTSMSQQLSCTRRCGALAEKISHTTPTWVRAQELMQCSMSGR